MRKITAILLTIVIVSSCQKNLKDYDNTGELQQAGLEKQPPPPPPPANANPAFAFQDYKRINNQLTVPAIYVMDVSGANVTAVYTNYSGQGNNVIVNRPDYPAWSADGTKLCFTLNSADLYTLNISLVNGVPIGSGATKIGDGVAGGGSYKQGKWRPGANQIACVWKRTGDPDKIHLLPSSGGSPAVLYTANTGWNIEDDIAFKSDGSNLVFSERQVSTGNVYLKVLDASNGQVINSIDMGQFSAIVNIEKIPEMDWKRSAGSNEVGIITDPRCDGTSVGINDIHRLYTLDVSAGTPALNFVKNDQGNISFSPDDLKTTSHSGLASVCGPSCCGRSYNGILIYTFATQNLSFPAYTGGNHHDWKR